MTGILLATGLPLLLLSGKNPGLRDILEVFATAVLVLLPVTVLISLRVTPAGEFEDTGRKSLFQALGLLRRNKPLLRLLSGVFLLWLGGSMFNAMVLFMVERKLALPNSDFLWFVFVQYAISVALIPVAVWAGNRFGRHRALVFGGIGFLGLLPLFMWVPAGDFTAAMTVFVVLGVLTNFIWVISI